jgi:hypothetical protein
MILISSPKPKDKWGYVYKPPIHCYITICIMVHGHGDIRTKKKYCKPWENLPIICCCLVSRYLLWVCLWIYWFVPWERESERERGYLLWVVCEFIGLFLLREREREREGLCYDFTINNWNAHVAPCKKHASVFVVNFCTLHVYIARAIHFCFHSISCMAATNKSFMHLHYWALWSAISHLFISFCNSGLCFVGTHVNFYICHPVIIHNLNPNLHHSNRLIGWKNLMHPFGQDSWLRYKCIGSIDLKCSVSHCRIYYHHHPLSFILARVNQHPLSTP